MKIEKASWEVANPYDYSISNEEYFEGLERSIGRVGCGNRPMPDSYKEFLKDLIRADSLNALKYSYLTVRFIVDQKVAQELTQYSMIGSEQESKICCNYFDEKFGTEMTVIEPYFLRKYPTEYNEWKNACNEAEKQYVHLIVLGVNARDARSVLPSSLRTELLMTMNLKEWRRFFRLTALGTPSLQVKEVTVPLLEYLQSKMPILFTLS